MRVGGRSSRRSSCRPRWHGPLRPAPRPHPYLWEPPFMSDVHTRGGRWGPGKMDEVRKLSKRGCVKMGTRQGHQKIGKFCGRHKWKNPLAKAATDGSARLQTHFDPQLAISRNG